MVWRRGGARLAPESSGARLGVLVAVASLGGCPQEAPRPSPHVPAANRAATSSQPPTSASGSDRAARPAASRAPLDIPPPKPKDRPKRTGAPGSTRGTVACGDARCTSPDACAWDDASSSWRCGPPRPGDFVFECDDGTDCPAGETCCRVFDRGATDHGACVARAEVDARCSAEICVQGGARCPPGRTCAAASDQVGTCEAPKGPATCGGKKPCPADRPICTMQDAGLACVEAGSPAYRAVAPDRRWQCTRPEDCGAGDTCFLAFGERANELSTVCGKWAAAQSGARVCDATGPGASSECRLLDGGPAWMGVLELER